MRPTDPAHLPAYDAGWADAIETIDRALIYHRLEHDINVFERMLSKTGPRPSLNATLPHWKRLLSYYYLADLHVGMDPELAADRDARRMEHFAKAFSELGL